MTRRTKQKRARELEKNCYLGREIKRVIAESGKKVIICFHGVDFDPLKYVLDIYGCE